MSKLPKRLKLIRNGGKLWVMSEYTGEIARPYEIRTIFSMARDLLIY